MNKDSFEINNDLNIDEDNSFIINNLFGELNITSNREMEISTKINMLPELQSLYNDIEENKKGILKKFVRVSLNALIIRFSEIYDNIKLYEIILYLIFNIHDRILKYLNEEVKELLREELKYYVK